MVLGPCAYPLFREGAQCAIEAGGLAPWPDQVTVARQRRTLTGFPPWTPHIRASGYLDH